jgi:hypothetical protein
VDLVARLARLRSLEDLSRLMASLGYEPLMEPVPELLSRAVGNGTGNVFAVARTGDFPWFAVTGNAADRLARRLAKRLAAQGRIAGVLGLDVQASRLAAVVAVERNPSLTVALDAPAPASVACLARLGAHESGGALAHAMRVVDALSGEAVGRRFFREFKATLDRMTDGLPPTLPADDRRSLALLQLTRVLFLYFIQAKGWLAGRDRFLADQVDRCLARRRRLHRDLLRPLFFGTLNRPAAERTRGAKAFGAIPFLNGGLFEPHPLERRGRGDIPNALWRDAFDRLFERFHFVVSEGGESGIAPDMLGRVFEGVMAPDVRRASGTYYTPAALVRSVLDAALVTLAAGRLRCGDGEAERRLHDRDPAAISVLTDITLLDPAVGSGAFLLGALERLASLAAPDGRVAQPLRRRILQRNLFGVDRSAAAVRLTELRLWLAVIADDREDRPEAVEPLPNLDCLVRQGDSLFEPVHGVRLDAADPELAAEVAGLRRELITATGPAKRELAGALRRSECRAAEASLRVAEAEAQARVAECVLAARSRNLFGERRGVDREIEEQLARARTDLRALRAARRTLAREREVPWFHYQSHFADVFARGGFDLVVGNPPWLRSEEIPADTRRRLAGRYRWWRRSGAAYGNRPDLAVAFLERAVELTAPAGVVAMLVPAKLATAGYGAAARHALAATMTLTHVVDLTNRPDATFDATVYPLALVARKAPPPEGHRVRTMLPPSHSGGPAQAGLRGGAPWVLRYRQSRGVLARLEREHPPLSERFSCHLGAKTGANHVFLEPGGDIEPDLLRWAVRGRDVRPFRVKPRARLLWTHGADGAPLTRLPPRAAAHLALHLGALRARADYVSGPPWMLFRTHAATAPSKVVWPDLARRLTACALVGPSGVRRIPLNTCYVAPAATVEAAERLGAWLNSTWLRAIALAGAVPAASGFHRFSAATVGRLPLPTGVTTDPELSALARAGRRGEPVQEALDDVTARHLGLSPAERSELGRLVAGRASHRR